MTARPGSVLGNRRGASLFVAFSLSYISQATSRLHASLLSQTSLQRLVDSQPHASPLCPREALRGLEFKIDAHVCVCVL